MLVGYWTEGEPETVTMIVEILGTDPNYAFQRLCDSSPTTALFPIRHSPSQVCSCYGTVTRVQQLNFFFFKPRIIEIMQISRLLTPSTTALWWRKRN